MEFKNRKDGKFYLLLLLLILISFSFAFFPFANAQLSNKSDEIQAGITPDSPVLWNFERFSEQMQLFFTFNDTKKVELRLQFADERLAEIKLMLSENNTKAAEKAEKARAEEIDKIENLEIDNKTKELIAEKLQKHISVLQEILDKSPENAVKGLGSALNNSSKVLEKFEVKKIKEDSGSEGKNITVEISNITNITCGYCQYLLNRTCLNYTCCKDEECNGNEICLEHECNVLNCSSCQYLENHKCVSYECCKKEDCGTNKTCVYNACINISHTCTSSCDDRTNWTTDYCNETTGLCEHIRIVPYCGNKICELEAGETKDACSGDCEGVIEALYCTQDSDCVPCCQGGSWDGEKTIWAERLPYGKCANKNYNQDNVPTLCNPSVCQGYSGECIECNKCVNNQCVTTSAKCPGVN